MARTIPPRAASIHHASTVFSEKKDLTADLSGGETAQYVSVILSWKTNRLSCLLGFVRAPGYSCNKPSFASTAKTRIRETRSMRAISSRRASGTREATSRSRRGCAGYLDVFRDTCRSRGISNSFEVKIPTVDSQTIVPITVRWSRKWLTTNVICPLVVRPQSRASKLVSHRVCRHSPTQVPVRSTRVGAVRLSEQESASCRVPCPFRAAARRGASSPARTRRRSREVAARCRPCR